MSTEAEFGPNHFAVEAFLQSLDTAPLFTRLGATTDQDHRIVRVGFDFLVKHRHDVYAPWGASLIQAEARLERLTFEGHRLGELAAIQAAFQRRRPNAYVDDFFVSLTDEYPGYYPGTELYAHELVDVPDRLFLGAANEVMLADLDQNPQQFFRSMTHWFEAGHWPCGWDGDWPNGRLILW